MAVGTEVRASKTSKEHYIDQPHRADPCDTEHLLKTRQGAGREPRDQHGELDMAERDGTCPKRKKENTGRLKKEVPKKIKARASAWRNKRNKNRKWRKYKDQSKR